MKNIWFVVFLSLALILTACSNDEEGDNPTGPDQVPSGKALLGLVDGKTLDYTVIDTTITFFPSYEVKTKQSVVSYSIAGNDDDWIISENGTPVLNLKVNDPFVLLNGYWRQINQSDAVVFFATPAVIIDKSLEVGTSWTGFAEKRVTDSGTTRFPIYNGYFGFHYRKVYSGTANVIVTDYAGSAHRYDAELFISATDTIPAMTITEFYAPSVGMVKQMISADGFRRIMTLRSSN